VDVDLSQTGRVMQVLSEHMCQGRLEGYLLTGRHGLFSCYEAFIHLHVRGYKEEGTTTTPFDMCVLNNIDRFQLTLDAIRCVPRLTDKVSATEQ
jgi:phosphoketolase